MVIASITCSAIFLRMRASERDRAVIAYTISVMFECITELMPEALKAISYGLECS